MPTYTYTCPTCGVLEFDQKITEQPLTKCLYCGAEIKRIISTPPSFILKGTSWSSSGYSKRITKSDLKKSEGVRKEREKDPEKFIQSRRKK